MHIMRTPLILLLATAGSTLTGALETDGQQFLGAGLPRNGQVFSPYDEYVEWKRDVIVIGGGASGTHAAVTLKDHGISVAVIERHDELGAHVHAFKDPASGRPLDYGVFGYIKNKPAVDFFKRLDVKTRPVNIDPNPTYVADFRTGLIKPGTGTVDPRRHLLPLALYVATIRANYPYLADGSFHRIPVEADIALPGRDGVQKLTALDELSHPFGDFLKRHWLSRVIPVAFIFGHAEAPTLLEAPTLYAVQAFGHAAIEAFIQGYITPQDVNPDGGRQLYTNAARVLGKDVVYNVTAFKAVERSDDGVDLVVSSDFVDKKGGRGTRITRIMAKKLLVAIPPTLDNLASLKLDEEETGLFGRWVTSTPYYQGLITNTSLPDLTNWENFDTTKPFSIPRQPFIWRMETRSLPGWFKVSVVGEADSDKAQDMVASAIERLRESANKTGNTPGFRMPTPEEKTQDAFTLAGWKFHDNLQLQVSPTDIRGGFYRDMWKLQGKRNTFYTGNAWCSDYSPLLWAFNEKQVLPKLLETLP